MKRLMMFLLTLAMVCTMGVISFAEGNIAPHDLSPEPIIPDVCSHLYSFKYATSVSETDPKTGRTYGYYGVLCLHKLRCRIYCDHV